MNLRYNRNCLRSLELTAKWSSIFGVIPWYDFQKQIPVRKYIYRCYAVLLSCLIILLEGTMAYFRPMNHKMEILYFLTDINNTLIWTFASLGTAFWNMSAWQRVFKFLHALENDCLHKTETKIISIIYNTNFIFLLGNINACSQTIFQLVIKSADHDIFEISLFIHLMTFYYFKFLFSNLVSNMVIFIKYKYSCMDEAITSLLDLNKRNKLPVIRKTKRLVFAVDKTVKEFNYLFGWPVLFQLLEVVLDSLSCTTYVLLISEESHIATSVKTMWLYIMISKVRKFSL